MDDTEDFNMSLGHLILKSNETHGLGSDSEMGGLPPGLISLMQGEKDADLPLLTLASINCSICVIVIISE